MDNFIVAVEDQSALGDGWKNVAPFKLSKQKTRKEKRKCTAKKKKKSFPWPFFI
jgi:hypothetical protein